MSIFASAVTKVIEMPDGGTVTIQKLSGQQLFEAMRFQADDNALWASTMVRHGVKAWSYDVPVTPETLADLSFEAMAQVAEAVLKLTKPDLFDTPEKAKAKRKNG